MTTSLIKISCKDDRLIPLGLACLQAYLKKNNKSVKVFNFRGEEYSLPKAIMDPLVQAKPIDLIMNHWDFPILIELIRVIKNNKTDLIDFSEGLFPLLFKDYAQRVFENPEQVKKRYNSILEFVGECKKKIQDRYKKIGFSVFYLNIVETTLLSLFLKLEYPSIKIIWGGPAITQSSEAFKLLLKEGICDGLVIGEGEYSLLKFVNNLPFKSIEGLMFYDSVTKEFLYTPGNQLDLDTLPTPDYTDIDLKDYYNIASVYRSRGCTHRCKFCGEWFLFGKRFRVRNVKRVVEDIEKIIKNHNPGYIIFGESLINDDLDYFERLCDEMIKKDFEINFGTHFRAKITPELARKAYKAGFNDAWIGVEALSDEELKAMNKGKKASQNIEAIKSFTMAGVNVLAMLVIGFSELEIEEKNCTSIVQFIRSLSEKHILKNNGKKKKTPIQFKPAPMFLVPGSSDYTEKKGEVTSYWKPLFNTDNLKEELKILENKLTDLPYIFQRSISDINVGRFTKRILKAEGSAGFAISGIAGYVLKYIMEQRRKRRSSTIIGTMAQKSSL